MCNHIIYFQPKQSEHSISELFSFFKFFFLKKGGILDGNDLLERDAGYGTGLLINLTPAGVEWPRTPNIRNVGLTGG